MLPDGSVKGGSAIKMRLGDGATRFTTDLDIARASAIDDFSEQLAGSLAAGWEGFTGALVEERQAHPKGVPSQYVMQPFSVKLLYNGKPWVTVDLEVGHNEIGDADEPDFVSPEDANTILKGLGFPPLGLIPIMALRHQIAQKLHAVSVPSSMRAHDLIDLQLLDKAYEGDYSDVSQTCMRLFAYRKMQAWPPTIAGGEEWATIYADQLPDGNLIPEVDDAIAWANSLINRIDTAR
ncbi:nucleotidyl transferase AbiEii/AbiGii toxin family protein [uncultured Senegalimassilia sp.]|uniref:nucleotidyl transferase AbiEii/AbiGii toxin family protein n=1 Tax=uncultured Senegalimassilia sp. TaxID=1714350 RepID=UPI0025F28443|nr:nucleotidyl transferase AbiEii/AbiGii toxin family protein [uncultured Senegalimassilia sp.]